MARSFRLMSVTDSFACGADRVVVTSLTTLVTLVVSAPSSTTRMVSVELEITTASTAMRQPSNWMETSISGMRPHLEATDTDIPALEN